MRRAERTDAAAIAAVHVASWKVAYRGLLPDEYLDALSPKDRIGVWKGALDDVASTAVAVFVAEDDDGIVVGFASLQAPGEVGVAELSALYIDPRVWSRGLGRQLLEAVVTHAESEGDTAVLLWVHPDNRRARAFYERLGWLDVGIEREARVWGLDVPERRYRLVI